MIAIVRNFRSTIRIDPRINVLNVWNLDHNFIAAAILIRIPSGLKKKEIQL